METLINNVKDWSKDRGLDKTDPKMQVVKLVEEFGELARGILKEDDDLIIDSLGDMLVVIIILHQQLGLELNQTLTVAYNEIKNRKGKTIDGVFIKEGDLKWPKNKNKT